MKKKDTKNFEKNIFKFVRQKVFTLRKRYVRQKLTSNVSQEFKNLKD